MVENEPPASTQSTSNVHCRTIFAISEAVFSQAFLNRPEVRAVGHLMNSLVLDQSHG